MCVETESVNVLSDLVDYTNDRSTIRPSKRTTIVDGIVVSVQPIVSHTVTRADFILWQLLIAPSGSSELPDIMGCLFR